MSLFPFISLIDAFVGGSSYPSYIYEDKYLAMRRNKEDNSAIPRQTKENFVLFTDEEVNQVTILYFYEDVSSYFRDYIKWQKPITLQSNALFSHF